jgi:hypothetical protein
VIGPKVGYRPRIRRLGAVIVAGALGVATVTLVAASAATTAAPPWQQGANTDPARVGTLSFYKADGTQIFSGSTTAAVFASYVLGSTQLRSGDTTATLFAYLPVSAKKPKPGAWTGSQLTGASAYPNNAAPAPLGTSTLPLVSVISGATTLADFIGTHPNTSSTAGYANVYELRLRTNAPQQSSGASYDAADIAVTGNTWQVVYPEHFTNTSTTLTATPASGAKVGDSLKLTATVAPAATGSVQFADGGTKLGSAVPLTASSASKSIKLTTGGTHHYTATYKPAANTTFGTSQGTLTYKVTKASSKTTNSLSKAKIKKGKHTSLTVHVTATKAVPTGTVTVFDGTKKVASAKLTTKLAGKVVITLPNESKVGKHNIHASYGGSPAVASSAAKAVALTVTKP